MEATIVYWGSIGMVEKKMEGQEAVGPRSCAKVVSKDSWGYNLSVQYARSLLFHGPGGPLLHVSRAGCFEGLQLLFRTASWS